MEIQLVSLHPSRICGFAALLCLAFGAPLSVAAQTAPATFETKAKQAYMIEARTGTVILSKSENDVISPASLAKILVVDTVAGALENREATMATPFRVSEHAWRTGGAPSGTATMFAALKSEISVDNLLKGVMVLSANDACIILGEGLAGSEEKFAKRMTNHARDLGLKVTTLKNASGLPDPGNRTTVRELVLLSRHLHQSYPDIYKTYALADFEWNKIRQRNRNPLVTQEIGIDGLATGFTEGEGYSIAASVERDGKRLFLALGGMATDKERQEETRRVADWGLSSFQYRKIFKAGDAVGEVSVYGGVMSHVEVAARDDIDVFIAASNPGRISGHITYRWPLYAPVEEGREVGRLSLFSGQKLLREVPLYTRTRVEEGGLLDRAMDAAKELVLFWW